MALLFVNNFPAAVWIALVYGDTGCGGQPFRKRGWYQVNPGQEFNAWNTNLRTVNRYALFYAEEYYALFYAEEYKDSGGATWSGNGNHWYRVPDTRFDQCFDDNTNCNQQPNFIQLDFQKADNGTAHFVDIHVTLGPGAGQMKVIGSVRID